MGSEKSYEFGKVGDKAINNVGVKGRKDRLAIDVAALKSSQVNSNIKRENFKGLLVRTLTLVPFLGELCHVLREGISFQSIVADLTPHLALII